MYNMFNQSMGFPQYPQFGGVRPQFQQPQFIVKQVTSIEEARASMIDPLSTYLFVDTATGFIYMKRLNNNGLSDFFTFKALDTTNSTASDPLEVINQRLNNIEKLLGGNYVQSVSSDAGYAESKSVDVESVAKSKPTTIQQSATDGGWKNRGRDKADGE